MNKIIKLNQKIYSKNFLHKKINSKLKNIKSTINTRFPPQANGFLHIGHIKSIFINIEIAKIYNGLFNIRIDDTNPKKNKYFFVKKIKNNINWILKIHKIKIKKFFFTSNYFFKLYQYSELLIKNKLGCVSKKYNINNKILKNLLILRKMRDGFYKEKNKILILNFNLKFNIKNKNLILYRIIYYKHYRVKYNWYIFPTYDYSHGLSDKIENIKYSICSLEFIKNKIFYKYILKIFYKNHNPKQIEFSRLKIYYNIISKRKLSLIKKKKYIKNLKDPRIYTIEGIKKKGIKKTCLILFYKNLGINRKEKYINKNILELSIKNDLKYKTKKIKTILNLLILKINNYPYKKIKKFKILNNNINKKKILYFSNEIVVEKKIFIKKFINNKFKIFNLNKNIKLKYSYTINCKKIEKNIFNKIKCIHCNIVYNKLKKYKNLKSINWINKMYSNKVILILYKEMFIKKNPKNNIIKLINLKSKKKISIFIENFYIKNISKKIYYEYKLNKYILFNKNKFKINKPIFNNIL